MQIYGGEHVAGFEQGDNNTASSNVEESARGLAQFGTLSRISKRRNFREVLDCGSPRLLLKITPSDAAALENHSNF